MNEIILPLLAVFLVVGVVVANKLIDATTIKKKDSKIAELSNQLSNAVSEKKTAQTAEKVAQSASEQTASLASKQVDNAKSGASLMEQAIHVSTLEEAIALSKRQVEENR